MGLWAFTSEASERERRLPIKSGDRSGNAAARSRAQSRPGVSVQSETRTFFSVVGSLYTGQLFSVQSEEAVI